MHSEIKENEESVRSCACITVWKVTYNYRQLIYRVYNVVSINKKWPTCTACTCPPACTSWIDGDVVEAADPELDPALLLLPAEFCCSTAW